jgi:stage V sporulation protein R
MDNEKRIQEVIKLGESLGLDPFPLIYKRVEQSTMFDICSYGLPTRARHWSYGRSYDHQKTHGEMGFSKVYEVILNNNPSYAFLLDTNTDIQNLFIIAHCLGHSDFFKNNCLFKDTNKNMIRQAAEHASHVDSYIERFGFGKVEHLMDIGFSLQQHINWNLGLHRKKYQGKRVEYHKRRVGEFDDFKEQKFSICKKVTNNKFPPRPESDLLWFFINYAPLEDWERDVLDIIREEAYHFYPQGKSRIMNEGWASYWHAEIMYRYDGITPSEHVDFLRTHEKVVQPGANGFSINPYFLGYRIFKDIEKRWDKEYGEGEGGKKIFEVRREDDDISFIRNYLTLELIEDLKLFTFGYEKDYPDDHDMDKMIELKSRTREDVVEALVKPIYNMGVPKISIVEVGPEGKLIMEHGDGEIGTLDRKFAAKTLEYIWHLWAAPIELHTKDANGSSAILCFDEAGEYFKNQEEEFEFGEEI